MSPTGTVAQRDWLRCYRPRTRPATRLICFPHAGGNAAFYRSWAARVPDDVELHAVQYPGRMDRIAEPLVRRMDELADRAAAAIGPLAASGPVAFFGHSLGASVAHEVARRLAPSAPLLVSGRPAPHLLRPGRVHLLDDDELWRASAGLGGTSAEVQAHDALRALALPALRADYEVAETYRPEPGIHHSGPLHGYVGDADPEVTRDEAGGWAGHTSGPFSLTVFPGNHFYLVPAEGRVVATVVARLGLTALSGGPGGGP